MARRRKAKTRTITRFVPKRSKRRKSSSQTNMMKLVVPSMIYGGVREKISQFAQPLTSKIPLGSIADEVGLATASFFIAKKTSGMIKNIAMASLILESARIGEAISDGSAFNMNKNEVQVTQTFNPTTF